MYLHSLYSPASADPEDLWDFGTVRHGNQPSTIGRAHPNPVAPVANRAWENGNARQSVNSSSGSTSQNERRMATPSLSLSVSTKGDVLPPIPTKVSPITPSSGRFDAQATVRNAVAGEPNHTPEGSGSDEYDEDYDDVFGKPANGTGKFLTGSCIPNADTNMYSPTFNGNTSVEHKTVQQVMGTFEYCKI